MSFLLRKDFEDNIAVIDSDSGEEFSYKRLNDDVENFVKDFSSDSKKLFILLCNNSYESIVLYLSVISSGNAVMMLDCKLDPELRNKIVDTYQPGFVVTHLPVENIPQVFNRTEKNINGRNYIIYTAEKSTDAKINPELSLLLTTSGSTGSSKFVRLSQKNILSNASSISEYLDIRETDRAITTLPIHYSYGLSVINSHLNSGACLVVTNKSVIEKPFWESFNKYQCSTFSGVPYTYQMLRRLKFHTMELPSLRYFTQAGGHLNSDVKKYFIDAAVEKEKEFIVMYGQTEATARISYVPFERSSEKIDSIGIAIPGGALKIFEDEKEISSENIHGEIVYVGDNVMMGYAENISDLNKGDILKGILRTGDLGFYDADGFFYVTGRIKRFVKIFGSRVNLDDVEKLIENNFKIPAAVSGRDEMLYVLLEAKEDINENVKIMLCEKLKLHHTVFKIRNTEELPVSLNGKKDYAVVKVIFESE